MKYKEVIEHIVSWLKKYNEKAGTNGFVVGISGGIDSAVTSTLCALTEQPVILLNMPIKQKSAEFERSEEHIKQLERRFPNVKGETIDLTPLFEKTESVYPQAIQDGLTMANTRARIRMTTLYAYASSHKAIVAGTGNKVEDFGVGFYTKYGDGGVDLSPIADLYKTEVFALADHLGVPESIKTAQPTDGLWNDDRTDEDQLGAKYSELEWAMEFLKSETGNYSQLTERQREVLDIYQRFHNQNKHKMVPIPVCDIPEGIR